MDDLLLRPATPEDADAIAELHVAARRTASMPPLAGSEPEVRAGLAARLREDTQDEVWVADVAGEVVGYARFTATWLDDLYVHPARAGTGVGGALLDLVKALRPQGFGLWVFEVNEPARAFYARRGLLERERTDGSGNQEREPDIRLEWPGQSG